MTLATSSMQLSGECTRVTGGSIECQDQREITPGPRQTDCVRAKVTISPASGVGSVAGCKRRYDVCSVCRCAQVKRLNICE